MASNTFMRVDDVANELDVSKSYAYKIVRKLNKELESKGIITIAGEHHAQSAHRSKSDRFLSKPVAFCWSE